MKEKQRLYRVMRLEHLFSLFGDKENVLVPPAWWDDPLENFVLKSPAIMPDGEEIDWAFRDDFFGQCWTRHKASDAMWRIYSPGDKKTRADQRGVRVRTTAAKLLGSLHVSAGRHADDQAFLERVRYLRQAKMAEFGDSAIRFPLNANDFAKTLLIKRLAFKHEREARLLFFADRNRNQFKEGRFHYPIEPHKFIEQIMIDPRVTREEAKQLKVQIQKKTGFKGKILHSKLYVLPKGFKFRITE